MAGWLTSRLKAAEQLLQQIDQQAAETLKKAETSREDVFGTTEGKTSEKRSHSLRKEKELYGGTSTSEPLPSSSRGRGRLFDRHSHPTRPGGKSDPGQQQEQQQSGYGSQKSAKASSSQRKLAKEGREDWSELLGSPDVQVSSSSSSRSSNARNGDVDGHGTSLRGSRTKSSPSRKSTHIGLSPTSRTSSYGDVTTSSTQSKAISKLLSPPARDIPKSSLVLSDSNSEKDNAARELQAHVDGESQGVKTGSEEEPMTNVALLNGGIVMEATPIECSDHPVVAPHGGGDRNDDLPGGQKELDGSTGEPSMEPSAVSGLEEAEEKVHEGLSGNGVIQIEAPKIELRSQSDSLEVEGDSKLLSVGAEESLLSELPSGIPEVEKLKDLNGGDVGLDGPHTEDDEHPPLAIELSNRPQNSVEDPATDIEELSQEENASISNSEDESSGSGTDGDTDSDDSDYDEKRRAKRMALRRKQAKRRAEDRRAAAEEAAKATIREREDLVERLEREKGTLEALLAEGEEQHVKMATELRASMSEVVQLLEQEKQQHNNTRRQALELEVKLEAENSELAKSLAASQRELEGILSRVSKVRGFVESKVDACTDLEREAALLRIKLSRPHISQRALDLAYAAESMEDEKSRLISKIEQYRLQSEDLEDSRRRLMDRQVGPTDIQLELEAQLAQITDSLIHKQAQVEELSTEKATLIFRVEAVSNTLREEKLALVSRSAKRNPSKGVWAEWSHFDEDVEYGLSKTYSSKDKAWDMDDRYDHLIEGSSGQPFHRLVRQVDGLVTGAAIILRRHGMARAFAGLYLLALHWWFVFILLSHPPTLPQANSGRVDSVLSTLNGAQLSINQTSTSFF